MDCAWDVAKSLTVIAYLVVQIINSSLQVSNWYHPTFYWIHKLSYLKELSWLYKIMNIMYEHIAYTSMYFIDCLMYHECNMGKMNYLFFGINGFFVCLERHVIGFNLLSLKWSWLWLHGVVYFCWRKIIGYIIIMVQRRSLLRVSSL
jgi:hypothetical protein